MRQDQNNYQSSMQRLDKQTIDAEKRLKQARTELKALGKKKGKTEGDKIISLQDKIFECKEENKQLTKQAKELRQRQAVQGKRLVNLQDGTNYPQKIRQLMEEVRIAKERQAELTNRLQVQKHFTIQLRNKVVNLNEEARSDSDVDDYGDEQKINIESVDD